MNSNSPCGVLKSVRIISGLFIRPLTPRPTGLTGSGRYGAQRVRVGNEALPFIVHFERDSGGFRCQQFIAIRRLIVWLNPIAMLYLLIFEPPLCLSVKSPQSLWLS